jgi:signal transduction histidine kinase
MNLTLYAFIFAIALVAMSVLGLLIGIFKSSLLKQLSTRITALILASGPITLFLIAASNHFSREVGVRNHQATLALYVLIALVVPIVLGLLAARFIRRPLRQFNKTVASLKHSNYETQLQPTGVIDFDETFSEFNGLIQRLQHEEKLRKDLISDTSHELNTPLTTMIGQLTAIQEGKLPMTKKRIATIKEQAERLADLVQQLDAYTKARVPGTGTRDTLNLRQFCKELIGRFNLALEQKGMTVKLDIGKNYMLHANRGALDRILTNLMQNALRYSGATELKITATAQELIFSDNGKGVPPDSLPYLFERFYRIDTSRSRASGGLGLGLAIVKEFAGQQGWHIQARPAAPGIAFVITLT